MKLKRRFIAAFIIVVCLLAATVGEARHGDKAEKKIGILLVAFGSSKPEAQISFDNIYKAVKAAYPDIPVKWAYTSHIIRKKLAKQGKQLDSPEVALAKMLDQGFTHVAVQSLHTIGGFEFHDLLRSVHQFKYDGGFRKVMVGTPLLSSQQDMEQVRDAMLENIPSERKQTDGVVWMGHGTHHPSNAFYAALMFQIQRKDPNLFIGCVEGYPEIEDIVVMLKEKNLQRVYLMPFMSVAGDHARNDMAGDDEDSWKSVLTKVGVECVPILKGTAEYDNMVNIWVDHLKEVLKQF